MNNKKLTKEQQAKHDKELMDGIIALKNFAPDGCFSPDLDDSLYQKPAKKYSKNLFNTMKAIITTFWHLLCIPFFLIFMILDDIRLRILDYFDDDTIY